MTLANEFHDWIASEGINLRHEYHEEVVLKFCKTADVKTLVRGFDREHTEIYDLITAVTFPDGSQTYFNYKGEEEYNG